MLLFFIIDPTSRAPMMPFMTDPAIDSYVALTTTGDYGGLATCPGVCRSSGPGNVNVQGNKYSDMTSAMVDNILLRFNPREG
jgi:hypothetical protein